MKVAILQRMVCHYEVDSLVRLQKRLADTGVGLKIFCGILGDAGISCPEGMFEKLPYLRIGVTIGGLNDNLVFLHNLFSSLYRYKPDLIVSEDICFMPNCLTVWAYSKTAKVPYLIRGLGVIPNKRPSRIRFFMEPLISLFRNAAKAFLCYSGHAAEYYSTRYNKPCYILCNSTLPPHTDSELVEIKSALAAKYSQSAKIRISFIGRLLPQKRVDLLLRAGAQLNCHIDILGDGPSKPGLEKLARDLGMTGKVRFHGQVTDNNLKKEIFKRAQLGVLPGLGGLAIQEMMWHGIPVISSHADGTERDLVIDGKTGFFVAEMKEATLLEAILKFDGLSQADKLKMASDSLEIIDSKYNVDSMVSVFIKSITENIWARKRKEL